MKENFCGSVILPNSPQYHTARQEFNRAIQKFPTSIAYCTDEQDVVCAVQEAQQNGRSLRVRSGGHNYEGFSVGNCAAVIDVGCMNEISFGNETLTAGPGALNSAIYEVVGASGFPFPSGTCPTVAVSGLTQGGGWGLSSRMFGLTCDSLLEATLIDARGERHVASAISEPDLFFALRGGGGGNFGVVTSLTYRLPPQLFSVTYVVLGASDVSNNMAAQFIRQVQQWLLLSDRHFTPIARIQHIPGEGKGLILRGIYYGSEQQARTSLAAFLALGLGGTFEEMTFLEAMRIVESEYPPYEYFTTGGRFVSTPFTKWESLAIVSLLDNLAPGSTSGTVSLYGLGGAVAKKSPRETAFFYRRALNIIALSTDWEDPDAEWANRLWFAPRYELLESLTCGAYINFPSLENSTYMQAYYGENRKRLVRVKARIDPKNVFRFPQSIRR
ncbi:MAG TPA: FAD-binding oxidoreductase [Clostridia bacterium]|nr:FAD-binding oxidoreductase [Clostridia bacterium]